MITFSDLNYSGAEGGYTVTSAQYPNYSGTGATQEEAVKNLSDQIEAAGDQPEGGNEAGEGGESEDKEGSEG